MFTKLFLFIVILQAKFVASDRFTDFVTMKLENFTTWLKVNNLDPIPVHAWLTHLSSSNFFAKFDTELRNNYVKVHSKNLEIVALNTSLLQDNFDILYRLNIEFYGEHVSNGSLFTLIPVAGAGSWHAYAKIPGVEYHCSVNFNLLPNGYLNITRKIAFTEKFDVGEIYFENLSDNNAIVGYEDYVREAIINGIRYLQYADPLPDHFMKYWEEIINETTLEEVYDGPIPTSAKNKLA